MMASGKGLTPELAICILLKHLISYTYTTYS